MRAVLLTLLLVVVAGCTRGPSEEQYQREFGTIMERYQAASNALGQPPAPTPGASREQQYAAIGDHVINNANKIAPLANDLDQLKPPSKYENFHGLVKSMITDQVRIMRDYGAAIKSADMGAVQKKGEELQTFAVSSMKQMIAEGERLELPQVPQWKQQLAEIEKAGS